MIEKYSEKLKCAYFVSEDFNFNLTKIEYRTKLSEMNWIVYSHIDKDRLLNAIIIKETKIEILSDETFEILSLKINEETNYSFFEKNVSFTQKDVKEAKISGCYSLNLWF